LKFSQAPGALWGTPDRNSGSDTKVSGSDSPATRE